MEFYSHLGMGKLLERSIELVILDFGLYTSNIEHVKLLYISVEARLGITAVNKF